MPKLELNSMILLMNTAKFRILPLYHELNHQELLLRHPLLAGIRGERADQDCDALVLKLEAAINKTNELLNSAIGRRRESIPKSSKTISDDKKEVEQNEIESILTELHRNTTKYRRDATISKLRHYSESKRIWKCSATWDIVTELVNSDNDEDIINGLYVMEYVIKTSQKENIGDLPFVIDIIKNRFTPKLLKLIYPDIKDRISKDSFRLLKVIIGESTLSKYSLEVLRIAMEQIENDNEYQNYIQIYVWHFENASYQDKKDLCDFMYDLTLKEGKIGERAANLYNYFMKMI